MKGEGVASRQHYSIRVKEKEPFYFTSIKRTEEWLAVRSFTVEEEGGFLTLKRKGMETVSTVRERGTEYTILATR